MGVVLAAAMLAAGTPQCGRAQVRLTQDEALRLAFPPPAVIERRTAFLTEAQVETVRRLAGDDVDARQRVVTHYVATTDGVPLGVAYFDVHRVRTLDEVLMIVVSPQAQVERIEVLRFSEPPEYEAPPGWLSQFEGRSLRDGLSLKGVVIGMTGATLTSRAVTLAVRRTLALHEVVRPFARAPGGRR